MRFQPHPYQQNAIEHILQNPSAALFQDMGMGKTVITLTAIKHLLHDSFEVERVLVIAPLRVAAVTWPEEIEKWDHLKGLRYSLVLGTEQQRLNAFLDTDADVFIINRENVAWLVSLLGKHWPFDTVVIDELSSFKSPKAQRFKALRKIRGMVKRWIGLTGTPAPNSLIDLWSQLYLLDGGARLGKTVGSYRAKYFRPGRTNGHIVFDYVLNSGADQEIYARIEDICVSMKAKDYLQMPERIDRQVPVRLSEKSLEGYKKFERSMVLEHGGITAANAAVLAGKLLQYANGAIYNDDGGVNLIHDAKLDVLEEIVELANGQPILVAYNYRHDKTRILERIAGARELKSAADIADWNAGRIQLAVAHPASTGHGLNLQSGGNIIVWFGLSWSLELTEQFNARLYRQGQQKGVVVNYLVAQGTVDEDVLRALERKDLSQRGLLEAVAMRFKKGSAA